MKSYVNDYAEKEDITVPEKYLKIDQTNQQEVLESGLEQVKEQYQALTGEKLESEMTDEKVLKLGIAGINSLKDLKKFLLQDYEAEQRRYHFYQLFIPYLLAFHAETAQAIINQEEFEAFYDDYLEQIEEFAELEDLVLEDYAQLKLGLRGDIHQHLKERAQEDFIFKLIARNRYDNQEAELTEIDYEAFIQQQVLATGADDIELKEQLSYSNFVARMPEIYYTNELYDYFAPQFEFHTNF